MNSSRRARTFPFCVREDNRQKSGCFRVNLYWNRWLAVFPFRAPLVPPTKNLDECQQIRPDCGPLLIGKRAAEASSEFYASFSF